MLQIFTEVGFATVGLLCVAILYFIVNFILNGIHEAVWVYKYKHRFDKPPTAACYCIDCRFHGDGIDRTRCTRYEDIVFQTAEDCYCQAAEPKERSK